MMPDLSDSFITEGTSSRMYRWAEHDSPSLNQTKGSLLEMRDSELWFQGKSRYLCLFRDNGIDTWSYQDAETSLNRKTFEVVKVES